MALTSAQAINLINTNPSAYATADALRALAAQVDTYASGTTTVLYGGGVGNVDTNGLAQAVGQSSPSVRIIDNTEAAKFLQSEAFLTKVASVYGVAPRGIIDGTYSGPATNWLYDANQGPWADSSSRFAADSTGDVRTITPFAPDNRIFAQTELPKLMQNAAVTHVNGVPKEVLQAIYTKTGSWAEVNKAASASSAALLSDVKVNTDANGKITGVDLSRFFQGTGVIPANTLNGNAANNSLKVSMIQGMSADQAKIWGEGWSNLSVGEKWVKTTTGVSKGLGIIGVGATALEIKDIADRANAAYAAGDVNGASKIIADGTVTLAGGWAAGMAAGEFAAGFFAPLVGGGPVGQLVYAVAVGASAGAGAYFGTEAIKSFLGSSSGTTGASYRIEVTDDFGFVGVGIGQSPTEYYWGPVYPLLGNAKAIQKISVFGSSGEMPDFDYYVLNDGRVIKETLATGQASFTSLSQSTEEINLFKSNSVLQSTTQEYDSSRNIASINQTFISSDGTLTTYKNNSDGTITKTTSNKFVQSTQLIGFQANGSETNTVDTQVANSSPSSIDHSQGGLIDSANTNVQVAPSMVDFAGNNNAATYTANSNATRNVTNDHRPYDGNIANAILPTTQQAQTVINLANMTPAAEQQAIQNIQTATANFLNNGSTNSSSYHQMTDPLILDLNGDGVKLTQFLDDPVMFDIDNDGGSLEQTGWVSTQDGIVVVDRNANGKIDNISETLSEYYGGAVGTEGSAGTKPFKDGFAALKSLDSNNDNLFNNNDATWGTVKVWVDDNHDGKSWKDLNGNGIVDAGEASELKTLTALGISQINLINQAQSGEVRDGNEVLARGTFTQNGTSKEALAVNFLANPNGGTTTASGTGGITSTQTGTGNATIKAYTTTSLVGENINVTSKGVTNAAGGRGNDTLTGDANNNWLAGGMGSDVFNAGAGNDVLLIDADDLQANINAGAGDDIVQVVGDRGITLNMAQAEVEQVQGGRGADVIIGGGRSTVFVRGGDGNDMMIGGSANDVLNGENGDDLINGGDGNDLLRGHRNNDILMGGAGNDILDGGLDDDKMMGGAGEDDLTASAGDDTMDGGAGVDAVTFRGQVSDYRFMVADGGVWVSDRVAGRDGTDFIRNVEKANFSNIKLVDIPNETSAGFAAPLLADDVLTLNKAGVALNRTQAQVIGKAQLIGNDVNWRNYPLSLLELFDVKGGTASINADGDVLFTPDASYTGFMGFKYRLKNDSGNGSMLVIDGVPVSAEVKLQTADLPQDTLLTKQTYLTDANVLPVWQHYTGKGVQVGIFEVAGGFANTTQIFNYTHADLMGNLDKKWLANPTVGDRAGEGDAGNYNRHSTMVAGVIASSRNNDGNVGVAYNASLAGHWLGGLGGDLSTYKFLKNYDVINQSWKANTDLSQLMSLNGITPEYWEALSSGRGGLGSVFVNAAGNDRAAGANTSDSWLTNNRYTVVVAGVNLDHSKAGLTASSDTKFSTAGANLLVSASGQDLSTTGLQVENSNGSTFGDETALASGTSFSAPTVSGIIALMLEANPNLGYRDVQDILAASARQIIDPNTVWQTNGARNWNGGGMHVSHDYGYGMIDARAAVRLAETWAKQETDQNNKSGIVNDFSVLNMAIPDNDGNLIVSSINVADQDINIEHVTVEVHLTHANAGDLIIKLVSPSGTESILMNRKGVTASNATGQKFFDGINGSNSSSNDLNYTFNTALLRGESFAGDWKLVVQDAATGGTGILKSWRFAAFGAQGKINDQYIYTNEFGQLGAGARATLNDTDGGRDTINVAAVSSASTVNLTSGAATIVGKGLTISNPSLIENILGGEFNDTLVGNAAQNLLIGGRGNDVLNGQAGNDTFDAYWGNDALTGGAGNDVFIIRKDLNSQDIIVDFEVSNANEVIAFVGFSSTGIITSQVGADVKLDLENNQSLLLKNRTLSQINASQLLFFANQSELQTWQMVNASVTGAPITALTTFASKKATDPVVRGTAAADAITGNAGGNTLDGLAGADTMVGRTGNDTYIVDNVGDVIVEIDGGGFDSVKSSVTYKLSNEVENIELTGSASVNATANHLANRLVGNTGNNVLDGGTGKDTLSGGLGNDTYMVDDSADAITELEGQGTDKVNASASFTLGDNLENLTLTGMNDISGTGNDLNNTLAGNTGGNRIIGWAGNDTIVAGKGNDDVYDSLGDELYVFGLGDGLDSITDLAGTDVLQLGMANTAIRSIKKVNNDLVIAYGASDELTLKNHFTVGAMEQIKFNDNVMRTLRVGSDANDAYSLMSGAWDESVLVGLSGDDTYAVDSLGDVVVENANAGNDTVLLMNGNIVNYTASANVENIDTRNKTDAAVNVTGNALNNSIDGNNHNNVLIGQAGNDVLSGMGGDDTYAFSVGDGTDTVSDSAGADTLQFNFASTSIRSASKSGNHLVVAYGVSDQVSVSDYFAGQLIEQVKFSDNVVRTLRVGSDANDAYSLMYGAWDESVLMGLSGDDTYAVDTLGDVVIEGVDSGSDTVLLMNGNIINYVASANVENIDASNKTDATVNITGNALNNNLYGNALGNLLQGKDGDDSIYGFAGNDNLFGGLGNDFLDGGAGNDWLNYGDMTASVTVDLSVTSQQNTVGAGLDTILNLEHANGGSGNDVLKGNNLNNVLNGNDGSDNLSGGVGNDNLRGGKGVDVLMGGLGNDTIDGGDDMDWVDYRDMTASVTVDLALSTAQMAQTAGTDTILNVERILGGRGNDTLYGNELSNTIRAGLGNDVMDGRAGVDTVDYSDFSVAITADLSVTTSQVTGGGQDTFINFENIIGGSGADVLSGDATNNQLFGNAGNDTLTGALGADTLLGGTGNDTYKFTRTEGQDVINDTDATTSNADVLAFQTGIVKEQLWFTHTNNDLVVSVIGTTDQVTIKDWYVAGGNNIKTSSVIEKITAGTASLAYTDVNALVQAMAAYAPPAAGVTVLPTGYAANVSLVMAANWH
ncbi:Bifunctional hemolysin/adenylate cyclase [Ephemeroptericola cinctiostellae]|uniref:Bifunctional hemolysin/adenylate cyclase n=1 Tax=Ephemeroptericola cinctiostellae TaxID=2268024 RepID=A0A345DDP8_9BURK|nr:S8 family serine peptidase [Ephemeroptericola cinctiostellae]AXF86486.1 Bifunctional hemolysin/adenylate cyclase [Ephemeroptericola cinctiostellae]